MLSPTVKWLVAMLQFRTDRSITTADPMNGSGLTSTCSEELFRYLLASERVRSERSGSSYQLLLVMLSRVEGEEPVPMEEGVAQNLLATLRYCLRGTDYTGWYHDGHIIGAVLTALRGNELEEISRQVVKRFLDASRERLSSYDWGNLRVRICQPDEIEGSKELSGWRGA